MSYTSTKDDLFFIAEGRDVPEKYLIGRQVVALHRYLEAVSKVHECVSFKGLKAYVLQTHSIEFPLSEVAIMHMVNDLEMRRNHTLHLIREYHEWLKDPWMKKMRAKPSRARRREIWKNIAWQVHALWPNEKGHWPNFLNHTNP